MADSNARSVDSLPDRSERVLTGFVNYPASTPRWMKPLFVARTYRNAPVTWNRGTGGADIDPSDAAEMRSAQRAEALNAGS